MSVLTKTDVPDETVAELKRRAAAHGVSVDDEARRVLAATLPVSPIAVRTKSEAILAALEACPDFGDEYDWVFDPHDPRNARPVRPPIDFSGQ